MLAHYLAVALAKFAKAPISAAASVLTLALGLACFVAAYGVVVFLQSGDSFHPGADRLYIVCTDCDRRPDASGHYQGPTPLAPALRDEMPELEAVARYHAGGQHDIESERAVSSGERKAFLRASAAEPQLFDVLAVDFVEGGPGTALRGPDDVVLSEDAARRLFGEEPALGRSVRIDGRRDGTVSAVIRLRPEPSFLKLPRFEPELITNIETTIEPMFAENWRWIGDVTLVRLPPSMTLDSFQARLDDLLSRRMPTGPGGAPMYTLGPVPVSRVLTASAGGSLVVASVPLGLGALILFVAGVSYANLAAAQAESRLKESGMRRVLGADRLQLLAQYAFEAGLLILPALGLAVGLVALAAPVFGRVGLNVTWFLTHGVSGVLFLAALTVATSIAVALYPAFKTVRVKAADALVPGAARTGSGLVARVLVGVQFFTASLLLIVVTVLRLQLAHVEEVGLDPAHDPVIVLNDLSQSGGVAFETLAAALSDAPQIRSMTATSQPPWADTLGGTPITASEEPGAARTLPMSRWADAGYFDTLGIELLAGRGFDPARDSAYQNPPSPGAGTGAIVIDERLARTLGHETPQAALGRTLYVDPSFGFSAPDAAPRPLGVVVGVMETDRSQIAVSDSLGSFDGALVFFDPAYEQSPIPLVRVDPRDIPGARAAIERAWNAVAPDIPLRARFLDEMLRDNRIYSVMRTAGGVFVVLGVCAIVISTTGLMGIAVYVAARRRREMGIRKTLGASAVRLARMLIVDFSKPVLIANLLAWPVAYLAAQLFLRLFAERIALTPATFLVSLVLTLAIAWVAIIGEVLKAASVRPAEVLRHA
jgi:putative ABC transport system permease protein